LRWRPWHTSSPVIHELRTYTLARGTGGVRELERRFGNNIEIRLKYSKLGGFFHTEIGEDSTQVVHIWPYDGYANRAEAREAANKDESGRWPPGIAELFATQQVEILLPAPFMRPLEPQKLGRVWELSWFDFPVGGVRGGLEALGAALPRREQLYPVVGCWSVEVGSHTNRIYLLAPFKDWAHRDEIMTAVRQNADWPPAFPVAASTSGAKVILPARFSTLS
jgi:hypothetical protein